MKHLHAVALMAILSTMGCNPMKASRSDNLGVTHFGAVGDGKTDCTSAFQAALDAAGKCGGGVVEIPAGNFLFRGRINIPQGVALCGVWASVPAHNGIRDRGLPRPTDDGTTLLVTGDAGNEAAGAFVTLNTNSTLKGVVIFYPHQTTTDVPTPYPYAIAMRGKNPAVLDCELLNPYKGIDASNNERHLVRNIHGQPLRQGIFVDSIYDIGRIENVHFNPWYSSQPKLFQWQMDHGEAFVFGRTDWQYVTNTFCFGYRIGYRFMKTEAGSCNGNFLGIGADDCQTAVVVDDCAPFGLLITNGEFVSFHGPDPTMVRVNDSNTGVVRFVNSAFWGPCNQIAVIGGSGTVGMSDCTFVQWDQANTGRAAILAHGGTVLVRGSSFGADRPQIELGQGVTKAVISDNVMTGAIRIRDRSRKSVVANNVGDAP